MSRLYLVNLIVLSLLVVIFALAVNRFKVSNRLRHFMSWKNSVGVAGVYLLVLLVSVVIVKFLPDGDFVQPNSIKAQEKSAYPMLVDLMSLENPTKKDLDENPGVYLIDSKSFYIDNETLNIKTDESIGLDRPMFIEQKNQEDGEIEVYTYTTSYSAFGLNLTDHIPPPKINYDNGTLMISRTQEDVRVNYKWFQKDSTVSQFQESEENSKWHDEHNLGWKIVLVRVPQNIVVQEG